MCHRGGQKAMQQLTIDVKPGRFCNCRQGSTQGWGSGWNKYSSYHQQRQLTGTALIFWTFVHLNKLYILVCVYLGIRAYGSHVALLITGNCECGSP